MAEYGIACPDEITERWTPAQAIVALHSIQCRRSIWLAEETQLRFVAAAAAQGGKKTFAAYRSVIKTLLREAGHRQRVAADDLVERLGLKEVKKEP